MITWIKLEPVPLKEKVFVARIESQIDLMIGQIKRSYLIPPEMEIENGGDGVFIGSDDGNPEHKAALENIMLDYPVEWDEKVKKSEFNEENASFNETALDYEADFELIKEYRPTIKLIDFLAVYAADQELLEKEIEKEIEKVDEETTTENFFPYPMLERVAEINLKFINFEKFYKWVLNNSNVISKLKYSFYIVDLKSLLIPMDEFINSFEDEQFVESLQKFCEKNELLSYITPTYLIWTK